MPKVETFTPEMLKDHLDKANVKYDRKSEDHFVMGFANLFEHAKEAVLQVMVNRDQTKKQLMIHCMLGRPVPAESYAKAVEIVNLWNRDFIYPTVFIRELQAKDQSGNEHALKVFFTKSAMDVSAGLHSELLDTFMRNSIGATRDFFIWLNKEHQL